MQILKISEMWNKQIWFYVTENRMELAPNTTTSIPPVINSNDASKPSPIDSAL